MSNWLSDYTSEEQKSIDALAQKTIPKETKETGFFSGIAKAPFTGAASGFAKVADVIATPFDALGDHLVYTYRDITLEKGYLEPYAEFKKNQEAKRNNLLFEGLEALEDKENTGTGGSIVYGISDFATRAIMGSAAGGMGGAIAVTGLSEGNHSYKDLVRKGVDSDTALGVAAVDAGIAGVSAALPIAWGLKGTGGIAKDAALSVGGATGLSVGGQAASGEILKANDYDKQAKKYEITAESLATEVLLNSFMFGGARYAAGQTARLDKEINQERESLSVDQIEQRDTQVQSALVVNELQADQAAAPVKPKDPIEMNKHYENLDTAREQIKTGKPVSVPHEVKGEATKPKMTAAKIASYTNKPWAKRIAIEAEKRGINPADAVIISHLETGGTFDPNIQPKTKSGKILSSAKGLFQALDGTHKAMGGGDRADGNSQINVGLNYYQHNAKIFKNKFGRDPSGLEVYFMHFFGEGGGPVFLKAGDNEKFIDVATRWSRDTKKKSARQTASEITNSHGFQNMTVGQVKAKYQKRWNDVAKKYGGDGSGISTSYGMDGSSYDMSYDVKSLDDLIASNDAAFGVNPNYPAELQPRDRTRAASREQIEAMANDLKPELLGESYKLSDGAPILGPDNVVESGNGRTLALRRAYETGKADEYRSYIEQYAREKGWDISGIKNPVLVRNRLTDTDRVQFAKLANESDVAQFSSSERARSDVDRLPDSSLLKINNDGSINIDGSMDYVRSFISNLPKSEQAAVMTADGRLSQDGKRRIESAIAQHAYEDSNLVKRLSENLDDESKNVLNAMLRAAPQLSQLNALVKQGGRHQNTIAADLAQAAQKLSDIKANGQTVRDYLDQGQLIDDGLSPGAKEFLSSFDQNKRSAKAIGDDIQAKIDEIEAMGDPRQGSLFGETPEEQAALEIIMQNPDQEISVSRVSPNGDVEEITMTLRQRLDELEAEAKEAQEQGIAAEAAANCTLKFGA
ncbi:transglycosylase [Acinetobacter larvae]|uniref:Transglycosylase n=1 Tax=Acinetobacter larvae TaxID=1789224 RepID=A0A1B2LXB8_9GAMM|nr:transglycosylase [Acinetobacter larvae]AOA57576.1 transglycosylase [Acinetobacter larvae]